MKLLLAADSITTLEILINEITARSWPDVTEACVLSIVEDGEVPLETWREYGYGVAAVRQEMRRRGEQIAVNPVAEWRRRANYCRTVPARPCRTVGHAYKLLGWRKAA